MKQFVCCEKEIQVSRNASLLNDMSLFEKYFPCKNIAGVLRDGADCSRVVMQGGRPAALTQFRKFFAGSQRRPLAHVPCMASLASFFFFLLLHLFFIILFLSFFLFQRRFDRDESALIWLE